MNQAVGTPKLNSIGVTFTIDCGEDISLATTSQLHFVKPDGTVVIVDGVITNDQYLVYTTVEDAEGNTLLDQSGVWKVLAYIVLSTWDGFGDECIFEVEGTY